MTQERKREVTAAADARLGNAAPESSRVRAYRAPWRLAAGALSLAGCASMPLILAAVLLASDPPITPPVLWRIFAVMTLAPILGAWLIGRVVAADARVHGEGLVLQRRGLRVEVPAQAIVGVTPWTLPLPGVGFSLRLRSGRRFEYGLVADDASELLRALAEKSGVAAAADATRRPMIVYAEARRSTPRRRWDHWALKFPLFALLPTLILFNAHQFIAYGGTFGQYYLEGPGPYLASFAEHWVTLVIYLVLYAAVWRGIAEMVAILAAFGGPAQAVVTRRIAESVCRIAYYGGVPLLLALRFAG